jgi:gliding motility-associated protein GldL
MAQKKSTSIFASQGWKVGMKYLYGWGAAIVILGALFKILHLPFANEMLIVGMGTETVIFFFSAFEPLPADEKHWDWDKIFPQLNAEMDPTDDIDLLEDGSSRPNPLGPGLMSLSNSMAENQLQPEIFDSLKASIEGLKMNVTNLADIADVSVATNTFSDKLRTATGKIEQLGDGYSTAVEAMGSFAAAITQVKNYQEQMSADVQAYQNTVQAVTKNLMSLNSVYEIELQDAQKHLNSINKFYGSISGVMQNLLDTSKDTDQLRQEVGKLAVNMQSLNTIYGNMLSAMASASRPA